MRFKDIPPSVTVAALAEFLGISDSRCRDLLRKNAMPALGMVKFAASVRAIWKRASGIEMREKREVMEFQNAEIDQIAKLEKYWLIEDAELYIDEERIAVRQAIEKSEDLSETQKKRLLIKLQAIKSKPPEPYKP